MPKRSRRKTRKVRKQKIINMVGCSKKHKHTKSCKHKNKYSKHHIRGGSGTGCGSCGCPVGGFTYEEMKQFGGNENYPKIFEEPVIIQPPYKNEFNGILGTGQNGGCDCGGQIQNGGNFFKSAPAIPGQTIGSPWEANKWPTEDGIGANRNYLPQYNTDQDPQLQTKLGTDDTGYGTINSMVGGNKTRTRKNSKRGGGVGFIKQELVNLGRDLSFNVKSAYNAINGYNAPVNPAPYEDQLTNRLMR